MSVSNNIMVETDCGKLEGVYERGLYTFKGVPYAAPPVGELRWLPPQPPVAWKGIRPATAYGAISPQDASILPVLPSVPEEQSEDCLFLNVYSPGLDRGRRPVMVWIHGGAFSIGSGSTDMYTTGTLASNSDVVLVTINYRLGVLGFLNLNEVTNGRIPSTGNEGLLDQVAALKWVQRNIAAFGGDPDNVTVFGESAGAMSIGCLLNLPAAQGLFQRAILESAVGEMARPLDMSVEITEQFLRLSGLNRNDIPGLRSASPEILLRAQQQTALQMEQGAAPVIPVADGKVMPMMPLASLEAGRGAKVPTLVGCNLDEDKFFSLMNPKLFKIDEEGLRQRAEKYVKSEDVSRLLDVYQAARAKRGEPIASFDLFSAINTDVMFRRTAIRVAEAQCRFAPGGYNYLFTWKSPASGGKLGACHVLEVAFIFGNYNATFNGKGPQADQLSGQMQDAWTSFARTGKPSCAQLGEWPQYGEERATMVLDSNCRVEKAVMEEERRVWETLHELQFANMP